MRNTKLITATGYILQKNRISIQIFDYSNVSAAWVNGCLLLLLCNKAIENRFKIAEPYLKARAMPFSG
jgi:hypothetical protein